MVTQNMTIDVNRLLRNVKLVRYVLQLLSDYYNFLTDRYNRVRYNEVLLYKIYCALQ
jgi:hypothetical protein